VIFEELDLSERLRLVMTLKRLTVADLARMAGVSKSAREKYLAGPSSLRTTAVASLCANLGISAEWLIFGFSDTDARRSASLATSAMFRLLSDVKAGELRGNFERLAADSPEFREFAVALASTRGLELGERMVQARNRTMRDAAAGHGEAILPPIPFAGSTRDAAEG
jgi:transcriptional regulator with XRE-family HTH domain